MGLAVFGTRCSIAGMNTSSLSTIDGMKAGMAETNEVFNSEVFGRRNFNALDQIYTADARILPPGAPMIAGREAIKGFWTNMVTGANAKSAVLTSVEVIPIGDGAVEIGKAVLTIAPPGQNESQMEAKYVVFWKQEDGRWKWHVDIWNANE
jgi:ketosteroid isomerase-like protein